MRLMPQDIFISYSSQNKEIGEAVCEHLENAGWRCWIAPRDVMPGVPYAESLILGLEGSRAIVLVFSPDADRSPHVLREVERATSKNIPIVTLRIEEFVPSKSMEFFLSTPHWLDAFPRPVAEYLPRLESTLRRLLQPGDGPAAAAARAVPFPHLLNWRRRRRRWLPFAVAGAALAVFLALAGSVAHRLWTAYPREITVETLDDILALDGRLDAVERSLKPDELGQAAAKLRLETVPGIANELRSGFDTHIVAARLSSLRSAINSYPLRHDFNPTRFETLGLSGTDPALLRTFNNRLGDAEQATGKLLDALQETAAEVGRTGTATEDAVLNARQVLVARETFTNKTALAHTAGLRVLGGLQAYLPPGTAKRLGTLRHLEPRRLATPGELTQIETALVDAFAARVRAKAALVEDEKKVVAQKLAEFKPMVEAELAIQEKDDAAVVSAKAILWRKLGRVEPAVAAFEQYRVKFGAGDPTAEQYVRTEVAFTKQAGEWKLPGGTYIYGLQAESAAQRAGLAIGDVIISYGGEPVGNVDEFNAAQTKATPGAPVEVSYLRLGPEGRFERRAATVPGGRGMMGAAVMRF